MYELPCSPCLFDIHTVTVGRMTTPTKHTIPRVDDDPIEVTTDDGAVFIDAGIHETISGLTPEHARQLALALDVAADLLTLP